MSWPYLLNRLSSRITRRTRREQTPRLPRWRFVRPWLEALEDRILLATLTVTQGVSNPALNIFPTITAAVDSPSATAGSTINVDPGTYQEQFTIPTSLTLIGVGGASNTIIESPATLGVGPTGRQSIVTITNGANVTMSGFTVEGGTTAPVGPNGIGIYSGILVIGNANLNLSATTVTAIHDTIITGAPFGAAIGVGDATSAGTATIDQVIVSDYRRNGIFVNGANSDALIENSTITGLGLNPSSPANNGIQIATGASATITGNTITNNLFFGFPATEATGILNFGNSTITGNTIEDNDDGIFNAGTSTISGNIVMRNSNGIFLFSGMATVMNNTIEMNGTGVLVDPFGGFVAEANIMGNNIIDNGDGILVMNSGDNGASGFGLLVISCNRIVGNMAGVVNDDSTTGGLVVDAMNNWWGSDTGPNTPGNDTTGGDVDVSTWLVLTVTISPPIIPHDGVATVIANLNINNVGVNVSSMCTFPDGIAVEFATPSGPMVATTKDGIAAINVMVPDATEIFIVSATLDGQTNFAKTIVLPPSTPEPGDGSNPETSEGSLGLLYNPVVAWSLFVNNNDFGIQEFLEANTPLNFIVASGALFFLGTTLEQALPTLNPGLAAVALPATLDQLRALQLTINAQIPADVLQPPLIPPV
jgi:parallel beta-helix repeat protein